MTPFDEQRTENSESTEQPPNSALLVCWRCGLAGLPVRGFCPHCRARLTVGALPPSQPRQSMSPVAKVLVGFALLLGASLLWGWVIHFGNLDRASLVAGTIVLA